MHYHLTTWTLAILFGAMVTGRTEEPDRSWLEPFINNRSDLMNDIAKKKGVDVPDAYVNFFDAGLKDSWISISNIFADINNSLRDGSRQNQMDASLLWQCLLETYGIIEQAHLWEPDLLQQYARDVMDGIPEGAIFFGGTDAGRFIPTAFQTIREMPTVTVITQNALANETYMEFLRIQFTDRVWLPSKAASNDAFKKYVMEVKSGRVKPDSGGVTTKDGRVRIGGVQGVMMINGILARNVYDENKDKHDCYVQESYVIPWMYPFLEPHGLIMKLNKERIQITDEIIARDKKFWDAYVTRLMTNKPFIENETSRKAFSKLRSSISGIYAYRRNMEEAAYGFRQAILLYPTSPEANFRLADVYVQSGQTVKAREVMEKFVAVDPENTKAVAFLGQLKGMESKAVDSP